MSRGNRGFTLVEILIVVIILGILAAIVIPQFGSSTGDAKISAVKSTLISVRDQIELFKAQHGDTPPASTALVTVLTGRTSTIDTTQCPPALLTATTGFFGPYMQAFPVNPMNGLSVVGNTAASTVGWIYTTDVGNAYTFSATDTNGGVLPY